MEDEVKRVWSLRCLEPGLAAGTGNFTRRSFQE